MCAGMGAGMGASAAQRCVREGVLTLDSAVKGTLSASMAVLPEEEAGESGGDEGTLNW